MFAVRITALKGRRKDYDKHVKAFAFRLMCARCAHEIWNYADGGGGGVTILVKIRPQIINYEFELRTTADAMLSFELPKQGIRKPTLGMESSEYFIEMHWK